MSSPVRTVRRSAIASTYCSSAESGISRSADILENDARAMFSDLKGRPNRHMTMAYMVAPEHRALMAGVVNVDGSCRPQIVREDA